MKNSKSNKKFSLNSFGGRQILLSALIVAIAIAGYLNMNYNPDEAVPTTALIESVPDYAAPAPTAKAEITDDYFVTARLERERSRSESMDIYRELTQSGNAESKAKAQEDLSFSARAIEAESVLEGLIKAKDFEDAVVYVTPGGVSVVVKTDGLIPAQAAQIKDIILQSTDFKAEDIKITEMK